MSVTLPLSAGTCTLGLNGLGAPAWSRITLSRAWPCFPLSFPIMVHNLLASWRWPNFFLDSPYEGSVGTLYLHGQLSVSHFIRDDGNDRTRPKETQRDEEHGIQDFYNFMGNHLRLGLARSDLPRRCNFLSFDELCVYRIVSPCFPPS